MVNSFLVNPPLRIYTLFLVFLERMEGGGRMTSSDNQAQDTCVCMGEGGSKGRGHVQPLSYTFQGFGEVLVQSR